MTIVAPTSIRLIAVVAAVLLTSSVGGAQSAGDLPTRREFRGLFGPTAARQERPRRLDLMFSVYDAQDDDSYLATETDVLGPTLQAGEWYSGATAALTYGQRRRHSQLTLNAASAARYYPGLQRLMGMRHSGGVDLDVYTARDWRVQAAGTAIFSPFYQVVLGPSTGTAWLNETAPPNDDFSVSEQQAMQYGSTVGVSHTYGAKSAMNVNYVLRYNQVLDGGPDSSNQRIGGLYTRLLTRNVGLRLGYAYGVATYSGDAAAVPIRNQDLDLGLSYGRAFAPSSGLSVSFSTGSTIVSSADGRHFRLIGTGRLVKQLSAQWTGQINYDRGLQVPDGATRPFFSDTVGVNLKGYLNRRVSVRIQPNYSHGVVGFAGDTNSYDSVSSSMRLDVAMSRRVALYGEYFYYKYQFASADGLPGLLTMGLKRQGARFGLTLWAPVR
ncbi:MAG: hypothetical protein ABI868_04345 [Acidobacteriota bacterium]